MNTIIQGRLQVGRKGGRRWSSGENPHEKQAEEELEERSTLGLGGGGPERKN